MIAVNYSTLRNNMKMYFDKVTEDQDTMIVTRKNDNIVIMSQNYYESLMETLYLTGNEANHKHLMKSLEQLKNGDAKTHDIVEE